MNKCQTTSSTSCSVVTWMSTTNCMAQRLSKAPWCWTVIRWPTIWRFHETKNWRDNEGTMKGQWRWPRCAKGRWRVVPRDRVRRSRNDRGWTRTTTSFRFNKDNTATLRVTGRRRRSGGLCWLCSKRIARAFSTEASYSYCKFLQGTMNVKPFFPCSVHKGFVIPIHFFS